MKIRKYNLILLASLIWMIAGFNVLKIGLEAYQNSLYWYNFIASIIIFLLFWFLVFSKLVKKHTKRILEYEEYYQKFYLFFDTKSFIIMICMMLFGVGIRIFSIFSKSFIAFFYTGLGSALFLAGIAFLFSYINIENQMKKKERLNMKKLINMSFMYFILAMIAGVFYREFTKYMGYHEYTVLSTLHAHLLTLGMFFYLILALFAKSTNLLKHQLFNKFNVVYTILFLSMIVMLTIRGILQCMDVEVTKMMNGMIAGISGLTHIGMLIVFIVFFKMIKEVLMEEKE